MPIKKKLALHNAKTKTNLYERLTRRWKRFRELIGADWRGSYLGLTRRLFIILVLTALVIAGITVLLAKLVSSGVKKASAPAEIDPVSSPGCYSLLNTRTNEDTNFSLTAVSAETDGEGYLDLREATTSDNNRHLIFDRLNDFNPAVA